MGKAWLMGIRNAMHKAGLCDGFWSTGFDSAKVFM